MKDEEMAEEYAEEYVMREDIITENDRVPFDNGYGYQTVSFEEEVKKGYKDGFLAGLKAGRPQWHDLRKNPNDLPEAHWKNWVIAVYDGGILWCRARREKCVDGVYWVNSYHYIIENVVMWAKIELPTFDME